MLAPLAARSSLELELTFSKVRDGCRVEESHPLAAALRRAYLDETGRELPVTGIKVVADAPIFEKRGLRLSLSRPPPGEGAHGDIESISEAELKRGARVYLRTAAAYLGCSQ